MNLRFFLYFGGLNLMSYSFNEDIMEKIRYRLVFNRRNRLNTQGKALVQVEALLNKRKVYLTTRVYLTPEQWDKQTATVVNHPHAMELNAWLYEFLMQLESLELSMWKRGVVPTLLQLKEAFSNDPSADLSFEGFSRNSIEQSARKKGTKRNLYSTIAQLAEFRPGYTWEDLTFTFLKQFERWLLDKGSAVNTVAKHLRNLRTLTNEAISAGYMQIDADPFRNFVIKHERTPHRFLNPEELQKMEQVPASGKLAHVRDAFLFCCYTGLRYSDFSHLREESFVEIKGQPWLMAKTRKTGYDLKIPLALVFGGKALEILKCYPSIGDFTRIGSNADANYYLSVLQGMAGIRTHTTFHTARHTCATLLCHQGVPITTVQKILGHTELTTTQIYSEVMAETIVRDLYKVNGQCTNE